MHRAVAPIHTDSIADGSALLKINLTYNFSQCFIGKTRARNRAFRIMKLLSRKTVSSTFFFSQTLTAKVNFFHFEQCQAKLFSLSVVNITKSTHLTRSWIAANGGSWSTHQYQELFEKVTAIKKIICMKGQNIQCIFIICSKMSRQHCVCANCIAIMATKCHLLFLQRMAGFILMKRELSYTSI